MKFDPIFYFEHNGRIYWKNCIYNGMEASVMWRCISGKYFIRVGEDWYYTAFENLELCDYTEQLKNKAA